MTAKVHIAAATQRITLAYAGYYLYFAVGWEMPPQKKLHPPPWGFSFPPNRWLLGFQVHTANGASIEFCMPLYFAIIYNLKSADDADKLRVNENRNKNSVRNGAQTQFTVGIRR